MNSRRPGRWIWVALAVLLLASTPVAAHAGVLPAGPQIAVGAADFAAGTVKVSVEASTGLSAVHFEDGNGLAIGVVASPSGPTADFDIPLHADMTVVAIGYDNGGAPVWESSVPLSIAAYAPGKPSLSLAGNALVGSNLLARGIAPGGSATSMTLLVRGNSVWSGPVAVSGGAFSLPSVPLPYGPSEVCVCAQNAFGQATSASVRVFNLGKTRAEKRFILVDKSDLQLYFVYDSCVTHVWPIAIGTPSTPTRTGTFKLGPWRHTPSAVWGPRRMALLKKAGRHYRPTSYYIHGTNDPSSIGTMASHGCVRMYSKDAIKLSRISRWYTVQIRK